MKNLLVALAITMISAVTVQAQRVAYVDIEKIMANIPDYKAAQQELDQTAAKWKQEISLEYAKIEEMYRKYQAEQVLLSESSRATKEQEIVNQEKQVREMQKAKFGTDGALFKKRQELVKPIQDKVFEVIEKYATERGYDLIFDKSSGVNILFAAPRLDKTQDILKKLGY